MWLSQVSQIFNEQDLVAIGEKDSVGETEPLSITVLIYVLLHNFFV